MTGRTQVNVRLDRELVEEIDRMAKADAIDRSEMARRLLDAGLATRRMQRAVEEYRRGRVTAWRAARLAGVSLYEMLDRIHEEAIPHELDADILDRVGTAGSGRPAIHERPAPYAAGGARSAAGPAERGEPDSAGRGAADVEPGVEALRAEFRPARIRTLFVGESSPAGGTHFYLANSNLFRATREAFALAFGEEAVPDGPRFLRAFQDRGCWLINVADRAVDDLPEQARREAVAAGVAALAMRIADLRPERVVAVKATIATAVQGAARMAEADAEVLTLPFPVRQWRAVYVRELTAALTRWAVS